MSQENLETISKAELNTYQKESFVKKYTALIWVTWILMVNDTSMSDNKNSKSKKTCQLIVEHPCAYHPTLAIELI